jgi:putative PIN family toxin of toxin-antitoxin system
MLKIVLDTNVLISGIITSHGPAAKIIEAVQAGRLILCTSANLLQEFSEVILRPKMLRKYSELGIHADALLDYLRANAILVSGIPTQAVIAADPDDDYVIACAIDGEADYIISGDRHLLELESLNKILIVSPREFVEQGLIE